ncbi:MAG: LuxR C-terminal-related transcriptional regulator [Candidatus Nanopelagicales bacterium]
MADSSVGAEEQIALGHAALADGEWGKARTAFDAALAQQESAEALAGLGAALWWLGEARQSLSCQERGYAEFARAGAVAEATRSAMAIAIIYQSDFGNAAAARGWIARAERLSGQTDDALLQAWVWLTRGYVTSDPALAEDLSRRALVVADATADADLALCGLTCLGKALVADGRLDEGLALVDEAMAAVLGGEARQLDTVVYACCDMLHACDLAGDLERATQWCRVADDFEARYGCPFLFVTCRTLYGGVLVHTGQWQRGEAALQAALRTAADGGGVLYEQVATRLADLRIRQGRLEEAAALIDGVESSRLVALPAARLALANGDHRTAAARLERALRIEDQPRLEKAIVLASLVELHVEIGDATAAERTAGRLHALAGDAGDARMAALVDCAHGQVAQLRGEVDTATQHYEAALARLGAPDTPYERARVRLLLAQLWATADPAAAVLEGQRALTTFESLGARADADATAALLRRLGASGRSAARSAGALSGREQQVLDLVAAGLSNPEIADRLFITRKTAAHHVSAILTKLGLRNRAEAVAYATRVRR